MRRHSTRTAAISSRFSKVPEELPEAVRTRVGLSRGAGDPKIRLAKALWAWGCPESKPAAGA